jgi:hypothetical protein
MRRINHIWRYLTSPIYRAWCDLMFTQRAHDLLLEDIKRQAQLSNWPPAVIDFMNRSGLDDPNDALQLIEARHGL